MKNSVSRAKYKCPPDLSKIIQEVNVVPGNAVLKVWDEIYYSIKPANLEKNTFHETNSVRSQAEWEFKSYLQKLPLYKQKIQTLFELILAENGNRLIRDNSYNDNANYPEVPELDRLTLSRRICTEISEIPNEDRLVLTYQICTKDFPELAELLERKTVRKLALINQLTDDDFYIYDVIDVLKIEYDRFNKDRQLLLELINYSENKDYRRGDFTWTDKIATYAKVTFDPTNETPFSVSGIAAVINMVNLERLQICQICDRIFWLKRKDSKTCSPQCANNLRVRNYRNLTDEEKLERKKQREANKLYNEKIERKRLRGRSENFS